LGSNANSSRALNERLNASQKCLQGSLNQAHRGESDRASLRLLVGSYVVGIDVFDRRAIRTLNRVTTFDQGTERPLVVVD